MEIRIDTKKTNTASLDLLDMSRSTRQLRAEVENVRHQLRQLAQMEECRAELMKQEEALSLATARLVNLSTALNQISDAYETVERKNADSLEERSTEHRNISDIVMYETDGIFRRRINHLLYK